MSSKSDESSKYQQMEHLQHIKELPDTYVSSSIKEEKEMYILNNEKLKQNVTGFQQYINYLMKLW